MNDIYSEILPEIKDKLVFDVGAAAGKMTKLFLDAGATVVAIEPQKNRTTADNPNFQGKVTIVNCCVSDENGEIKFYECPNAPNISSCNAQWKSGFYKGHERKWPKKIVPCLTLNKLIRKYGMPFYIKIDVEGYEDKVLGGLKKKSEILSFEYTAGYKEIIKNCFYHIKRLGYEKIIAFEKKKEADSKLTGIVKFQRIEFSSYQEFFAYYMELPTFSQGDILLR